MFKQILFLLLVTLSVNVHAEDNTENNFLDSEMYDPNSPDVQEWLNEYDQIYEEGTGLSPFIGEFEGDILSSVFRGASPCYRASCPLWAHIVRSEQRLYLYKNGQLINGAGWPTSTGVKGHGTPAMDTTISGRIYNKYSSGKYPGGDYNGLGNMPYAVFIAYGGGGFAIHGTPKTNWKLLGSPASHGCIRIHPDNASYFNKLVRSTVAGSSNRHVWISIQ